MFDTDLIKQIHLYVYAEAVAQLHDSGLVWNGFVVLPTLNVLVM